MKNLIIVILLITSSKVFAKWDYIGSNGYTNYYVSTSTIDFPIRKEANLVAMWSLSDSSEVMKADGVSWLSYIGLDLYDCSAKTKKPISYSIHSDNMGEGTMVRAGSSLEVGISSIRAGSITAKMWEIACIEKF